MSWKCLPLIALTLVSMSADAGILGGRGKSQEKNGQQPVDPSTYHKRSDYAPCPPYYGFYFVADTLVWAAENNGFSYAFNRTNETINTGNVMRLGQTWDPGFRFGIGWNTGYDAWDVLANWTWFRGHTTDTSTRSDITTTASSQGYFPMWPVWNNSGSNPGFKSVKGDWRVIENMIDLEVGKGFYVNKALSLRPHIGARFGWLNQRFYDQFTTALAASPTYFSEQFTGKNNYWGGGPRTGVQGDWQLDYGVSLMGRVAGALLYGKTNVSALSEVTTTSTGGYTTLQQYTDVFTQLVPNLQMALGFQWGTCYNHDKMYFGVSVAWETNYWWNQFNLPVSLQAYNAPLPSTGNQPLTTEGVTVDFEFGF